MSAVIHQEIEFEAAPEKVYSALMDAAEHSQFTGEPAEITADAGGTFSCYGGQIGGRNIELVAGRRIVQAWRVGSWDEGVYSLVRIELEDAGGKTKLTLDHSAIDDEMAPHLESGWHARYWEPLAKYLG